jgi:flagellar motility protein MotE (MotC chaperone)
MIRLVRNFRLVPVVLAATICLFVLKTFGLVLDGGYLFGPSGGDGDITGTIASKPAADARKPGHQPSWAQEMLNFPDVTGSVSDGKPTVRTEQPVPRQRLAQAQETTGALPGTVPTEGLPPSPAERQILERLQERRLELEARARELDMRENLMKAAEKRVEARVAELKDLETRVNGIVGQRDEGDLARFKNVVTMYENMKAKDAAKIFDKLEMKVLVDVAKEINPRRMSDILAQMSPDTAQKLTLELAARSSDKPAPELPKIEGNPPTN